jgi:hypothetical protein
VKTDEKLNNDNNKMETRNSSLRKIIAGIFVIFLCILRFFKVDLDFNLVKKKKKKVMHVRMAKLLLSSFQDITLHDIFLPLLRRDTDISSIGRCSDYNQFRTMCLSLSSIYNFYSTKCSFSGANK